MSLEAHCHSWQSYTKKIKFKNYTSETLWWRMWLILTEVSDAGSLTVSRKIAMDKCGNIDFEFYCNYEHIVRPESCIYCRLWCLFEIFSLNNIRHTWTPFPYKSRNIEFVLVKKSHHVYWWKHSSKRTKIYLTVSPSCLNWTVK